VWHISWAIVSHFTMAIGFRCSSGSNASEEYFVVSSMSVCLSRLSYGSRQPAWPTVLLPQQWKEVIIVTYCCAAMNYDHMSSRMTYCHFSLLAFKTSLIRSPVCLCVPPISIELTGTFSWYPAGRSCHWWWPQYHSCQSHSCNRFKMVKLQTSELDTIPAPVSLAQQ
jgi:hypothetical protein